MYTTKGIARGVAIAGAVAALGACSQVGSLGGVLGSVLQPQPMQASGTVRNVDTRNAQISIQQSDGQSVAVYYDNRTKVVYQNQLYSPTSLEYGDQVIARLQDQGNNTYYSDSITVTMPVRGSTTGSTTPSNVQSLQGTVRQVDVNAGWFTLDTGNGAILTVSMPYRASSADMNRFQGLHTGDFVRIYGVFLNNTRVELQRFN